MVHCMESDPLIVGLCGETRVANKFGSFATMIQVFEYHIGHVLGKAFESVFGGVTCLPGCFAMYRIKVRKTNGYFIPLLANPDIVLEYASDETETLHRKNLLLLGEDRYLTTLMLKTFPKRKMVYVPKAICHTQVPESFRVLFSQRRRWINSTIHNLLELIMVRELCGIFCCSMQFVIFLELLGTAVLPASFLLLIYLAVTSILNQSIALPLVLFLIGFFLQAILVTLTSFRIEQFFWLIMYVLGLPVWYFFMPLYSFWVGFCFYFYSLIVQVPSTNLQSYFFLPSAHGRFLVGPHSSSQKRRPNPTKFQRRLLYPQTRRPTLLIIRKWYKPTKSYPSKTLDRMGNDA